MKNLKELEEHITGRLKRELPKDLYYHGIHHTYNVLQSAEMIAKDEKISEMDMLLLKVAVLYHDAGFIKVYMNHEDAACELIREDLPRFGFSKEEIATVAGMIMATKIPQHPHTQLEKIIADADLEYLGTDNYNRISQTLFEEIKIYLKVESERQWQIVQMNFLKSHQYFTDFCKKNREAAKQKHLAQIIRQLESNK